MACRLQSGQPSSRVSVSSTDEFLLFLPCVSWHFSSSLLSWFYINFENSDIFLLYLNNLQCHQLWYLPASLKSAPMISLMFRYRYTKLAQDSQQLLGEKPIAVSPSSSLLYLPSWFSGAGNDWLQWYWSHILLVIVFSSWTQSNSKFYWLFLIKFSIHLLPSTSVRTQPGKKSTVFKSEQRDLVSPVMRLRGYTGSSKPSQRLATVRSHCRPQAGVGWGRRKEPGLLQPRGQSHQWASRTHSRPTWQELKP